MKPQDFVREYSRLCDAYRLPQEFACKKDCPFNDIGCTFSENVNINHPERFEKAYNIVEKWSDAHPAKTKSDEFLKLHPDAMINADGVVAIPPCFIEKNFKDGNICENFGNKCDECTRQYWSKGVDD